MGAHLLDLRHERLDAAVEGVERESADLVGPAAEAARLNDAPQGVGRHELCAVEQRQALFAFESDRFPSHGLEHLRRGDDLAVHLHLSEAQQREREVGQRGEVARSAERALLIDQREDRAVVHLYQALHRGGLHARIAVAERLDLGEKHEPDNLGGDTLAHAAGVGHDQIALERGELVGGDGDVAERAESGGDAVDRFLLRGHLVVEILAAAGDACACVVAEGERYAAGDDLLHAVDGEGSGADMMYFHMSGMMWNINSLRIR